MSAASRLWAAIGALVLLIGAGGEAARLLLRYQREAILAGEWWRLGSAHVVHLGWSHLALDLGGLLVAWLLFGGLYSAAGWLIVLAGSAAAIDVAFLLWHPEVAWYLGLSGVLHGLFVAGGLRWVVSGVRDGWWLLAGLAAKLLWEAFAGPLPFTEAAAGGPVLEESHLYGALGGGIAGLGIIAATMRRSGGDPL